MMKMKSAGRKKSLDMMEKLMKMKKMRMKMRMKRRKKVGKVKREREKQMTKEKMTKPRDSLQDTELLSMVGLLMDLVAVLKR
ncbi:acidic nuclear phosphoprotein 32 family, member B, isoform CRA_a [Rattus norvegicus]|uniref:Acidic nuclear phosphoprotein 32 family, member B, isoform CRA_a n=1 Tax=Rattus norvegicus TaxID=10116 RepID=A6IJC1_RAT|nr:acidic nuclear phosphoprotein 32 family, member B, isoform CRA_a [Rattus norvegicus]